MLILYDCKGKAKKHKVLKVEANWGGYVCLSDHTFHLQNSLRRLKKAQMKLMRRTARYSFLDHRRREPVEKK